MGVKSTRELTRDHAENLFVELWLKTKERKARSKAVAMSDKELEYVLQTLNDEAHDGEGFTNYLIVR